MRLIIAGGRDFNDINILVSCLNIVIAGVSKNSLEIVTGMAAGADMLGYEVAKHNGIIYKEFPAKWDDLNVPKCKVITRRDGTQYNVLAGYNRNEEMADYADTLLAIWDGRSKGTKHMIDLAVNKGLIVYVYDYYGNPLYI